MSKKYRLLAAWETPVLFVAIMGGMSALLTWDLRIALLVALSCLGTTVVTTLSLWAADDVEKYDHGQPMLWEGDDG